MLESGEGTMVAYRKFAYVYDELMEDMPYPEWIAFAEHAWSETSSPRTVVDLGCGTGSIAIPLAVAGYQVTGLDLSEDMLAVARQKLERTSQGTRLFREGSLQLTRQDMTSWTLPEQVDAVISFCDCMNYLLEEADVIRTFQATWNALKPGGTFIFDVHHPDTLRSYEEEQPFIWDEPSLAYIWTCERNDERNEIEHHLTIFAREEEAGAGLYRRFEETHIQRAYDPEWIRKMLLQCGFKSVSCHGDFSWNAPIEDAARLFFVAVK